LPAAFRVPHPILPKELQVLDVLFVAVTLVLFGVFALVAKGVERL
jgi:cell division protein FtsX